MNKPTFTFDEIWAQRRSEKVRALRDRDILDSVVRASHKEVQQARARESRRRCRKKR